MVGFGIKSLVDIAVTKIVKYVDEQDGQFIFFKLTEMNSFLSKIKGCNHKLSINKLDDGDFIVTLSNKNNVKR